MDRFDALTAFVTIVDRHGFAPAARHLGLAPSAVTRQVAALEDRLGVRLLTRTTRSVTLTDAGARFLERARRILAELREAEDSAQSERGRPAGRLTLTAPAVFGRLHVAPLVADFLAQHEEVSVRLLLNDRMINLVEEGVDLAIRIGPLPDSGLVAKRLGETRRVVVAAPAYLDRHGTPAHPGDLQRHATIGFTGLAEAPEWRFAGDHRVAVQPRLTTNSADAAIWAAEQGQGLTQVLGYQVKDAVAAGRLRVVLAAQEPPALPIHAVHPASRLLSAALRAFIDLAVARADWHFAKAQSDQAESA
ncbi:LysR family transcriptional regulator [Roseomonas stagni]|uniref:LysR family transcriptional regulator n=1 Tax=Falsiroseomonas algicola TaxID=2716930 RepID=A0A6M1LN45_9PROT|nr:LysR family transcriptional regulator [Falsiroseomonas algicola]NGM21768.1 LysR family transcriptional regulator [Falsiroseomonas algicola]